MDNGLRSYDVCFAYLQEDLEGRLFDPNHL